MSNFILKRREFDAVPTLLLEAIPSFGQSDEFKSLDEQERSMPGLVCAAFAKYSLRLQDTLPQAGSSEVQRTELEQCYASIEKLASSSDPAVNNLVVVEIFENISGPEGLQSEIKSHLKSKSLALYNRWLR